MNYSQIVKDAEKSMERIRKQHAELMAAMRALGIETVTPDCLPDANQNFDVRSTKKNL